MIILKKLTFSKCFSYGEDIEINLENSPVTQIIGVNGAGKSSIPLIIEEALFNKNSKNIKKAQIPNRHFGSGYDIRLYFSKDGDEYSIEISRKASLKLRLEKNGENISSHTATDTYKTIQGIIGLDFKTFSQLVYQSTNSSLQFLTATDTNRKRFLIDLLHLEEYVKYFELFKEKSKEASTKVAELQGRLTTVERWLAQNNLEDTTILPMLNLEIESAEDEELLRSRQHELKNISEKNSKISRNNSLRNQLNSLDTSKLNSIKATEILPTETLVSKKASLQTVVNHHKAVLNKLEGLGNSCHTCGQDIDSDFKTSLINENLGLHDAAIDEIKDITDQLTKINKNNAEYREKQSIQKTWEELYKSVDQTLSEKLLDPNELKIEIERLANKIKAVKEANEKARKENDDRARHNAKVEVYKDQRIKFETELSSISTEFEEVLELNSNLEVLKKAFSTNGLVAYKIENLVKELEELTNEYLAELSQGRFTIEFIVSNDKLNVSITDNGKEVEILALSSGELARVNTATLLAIRKLMSSISKSKINVLFLDEVIAVLDDVGKETLVEVLIKEKDLNTFIVSHGWTHPLLDKIEVIKEGEVSRLE